MVRTHAQFRELTHVLEAHGVDWRRLFDAAAEVVLFGSRATGVDGPDSDWDVLVIGPGRSLRSRLLDLVVVSREKAVSAEWLGSELASHVALYGVWLKGEGAWRGSARVSPRAIERKVRRLHLKVSTYARLFYGLRGRRAVKHSRDLRRELQRLERMLRAEPVPPTPTLDAEWAELNDSTRAALVDRVSCSVPIGSRESWQHVLLMQQ